MRTIVFGANGITGRLLCAQALAEGHAVTAVTRNPTAFPVAHPRLTVRGCDVFDADAVADAIQGHDAVLSALGVPYSLRRVSVYSTGIANILRGMERHGVRRLVCVSSSGTDPALRSRDTGGGFLFEKVLKPLVIATLGRTVYADLLRMERLVAASDVDRTIVRPGALFDLEGVTDYITAPDFVPERSTARADLADCVLRQLDDPSAERGIVAVATVHSRPGLVEVFWKEALQSISR